MAALRPASSEKDAIVAGLTAALPAEGNIVASPRGVSDGGLTAVEQAMIKELRSSHVQAMIKEFAGYREQVGYWRTFARENIARARSPPKRDEALEQLAQMVIASDDSNAFA